jgi:predicted dehydrogenase
LKIKVALVGFGYWGPNLARNFSANTECDLAAICETNSGRAARARTLYPQALVTDDYRVILDDPEIHAVLIATPVSSHYELARAALLAGKDVLVEKPLTASSAEARDLIDIAERNGRILAVDHTFLFTGAVQKMKEIVDSGELGDILYMDSVRINLGLFQHDVNVIWDLAPHDLSIMAYLLPYKPVAVSAVGSSHAGNDIENIAYLHVEFGENVIAHFHLNWLAPVKIRRTIIGGTKKMVIYDDMEPSEKVKVYDTGIDIKDGDTDSIYKIVVDYRTGDMVAPKLAHREALSAEAAHFIECVKTRKQPMADGRAGLYVTHILEAAQASIRDGGRRILLENVQ